MENLISKESAGQRPVISENQIFHDTFAKQRLNGKTDFERERKPEAEE